MRHRLKNHDGYTLMELMVGSGVTMIVVLGAMSLMLLSQRSMQQASTFALNLMEGTVGDRYLASYFRNAGLTYNVIGDTDDTGRPFWTYMPDYPRNDLTATQAQREMTIRRAGPITSFHMIVRPMHDRTGVFMYDPSAAYAMGSASGSASAGSLSYSAINFNSYVSNVNAALWNSGQHVALYSPILLRPPGTLSSVAPRPLLKVGRVSGSDLIPETFNGQIDNRHPADAAVTLTSFDQFLRAAPAVGGGAPFMLMSKIELLQVRIVLDAASGKDVLQIRKWNSGSYGTPNTIASNVEKLILKRPSVTIPRVVFELKLLPN